MTEPDLEVVDLGGIVVDATTPVVAGPRGLVGPPGLTLAPQVRGVRKSTNEVRTGTATPTGDAELLLTNVLTGTYLLDAVLYYDATTTADCRFGWTLPAGSTIDWTPDGLSTAATSLSTTVGRAHLTEGTAQQVGAAGAGIKVAALPRGVVVITTPGTVSLVWAQGVADPSGSTLYAGSTISLVRIT